MKKLILLSFVLLAFGSVFAQDRGSQGPKGGRNMDQLIEKLQLSEAQQKQFATLNDEFRQSMQSLMQEQGLSEDDMRTRRKKLVDARDKKMMEILNPDQRTAYQTMRYSRPGLDIEDLKTKLALTEEQIKKLTELEGANHDKEMSVMSSSSSTEEQKKMLMEEMSKNKYENLNSILTPEQRAKFDAMNPAKKDKGMN